MPLNAASQQNHTRSLASPTRKRKTKRRHVFTTVKGSVLKQYKPFMNKNNIYPPPQHVLNRHKNGTRKNTLGTKI